MSDRESRHWLDHPENQRLVRVSLYVACAILFALDFFIHRHVEIGVERFWGFYAIFGFVACVLLVLVAKEMRKVVMRKEDYYDVDR